MSPSLLPAPSAPLYGPLLQTSSAFLVTLDLEIDSDYQSQLLNPAVSPEKWQGVRSDPDQLPDAHSDKLGVGAHEAISTN